MHPFLVLATFILPLVAAPELIPPGEFSEKVKVLAGHEDVAVRLAALEWLESRAADARARAILPDLAAIAEMDHARDDAERIVNLISQIARKNGEPCPAVLLHLAILGSGRVKESASKNLYFFDQLSEACFDTAANIISSKTPRDARSCLFTLTKWAKQPRTVVVVQQAKSHERLEVRAAAHSVHLLMTKDVASYVPFCLLLNDESDAILGPIAAEEALIKEERRARRHERFCSQIVIALLEKDHAPAFAEELHNQLKSRNLAMRRCAARQIAIGAVRWAGSRDFLEIASERSQPGADRVTSKEPASQSELAKEAELGGIRKTLETLAVSDPDATVRAASQMALEQLNRVSKQK